MLRVFWLFQSLFAARDRWEHPCAIEAGLPRFYFQNRFCRKALNNLVFRDNL